MSATPLFAAASIPSAPVLVDGVGVGAGGGVGYVRAAVRRVARRLPDTDVMVLVAGGQAALHDTLTIDLAGIGYPHITRTLEACPPAIEALSRMSQYPRVRRPRLPLDLGVLAVLLDVQVPVVALEVPAAAEFNVLSALGTSVVQALDEAGLTGVLVAAGDLSAGLQDRSPLAARPGAVAWDERVVALFNDAATHKLADLGPEAASTVGARAWAPLSVLHGAAASASLTVEVRRYSAPLGVGYLVASSA